MNTGDRKTLSMLGEQAKDITAETTRQALLLNYLRGLPSLMFSEKGRANVCQRFGASEEELTTAMAALHPSHPCAPAIELLRTIGEAVCQRHNADGGADSC